MRQSRLESRDYSPEAIARNETLFTTANGSLGLRGDFEEREGTCHKGTYINGFFDTEPIVYGESAYGFAENHETILNLPDPKRIELTVNGHPFSVQSGTVSNFLMTLDFETGAMTRSLAWTAPDGSRVSIVAERIACLERPWAAAIRYTVRVLGRPVVLSIKSMIDATVRNLGADEDPRIGSKFSSAPLVVKKIDSEADEGALPWVAFAAETRNSGFSLAGRAIHSLKLDYPDRGCEAKAGITRLEATVSGGIGSVEWVVSVPEDGAVVLEKYIAYEHERATDAVKILADRAKLHAESLAALGFEALLEEQRRALSVFWNTAALEIDGDPESELALHFNLFHLYQSAGRDGKTSIAAKGLTAEGYEGHFFWDTEAYVCPVFTYLQPEIAGKLLEYRHGILPAAKRRAAVMSLKGALFPWRTIDGEETSAYYPAGTAQYHIDADIMFALRKYLTARAGGGTFDPIDGRWFDSKAVYEMAVETARMWMCLGSFVPSRGGAFCINGVTGPDEYTACVDNNAYTNLMARENLRFSILVAEAALARLAGGNGDAVETVDAEEIAQWRRAAESMYVPYDPDTGIYPQDDSFMGKAEWDFEGTPSENYPLLLHYHPLVIYRHRVLKQPDLVLAQFMLSGAFTLAEKRRNFTFYERLTTGDSSLSHCIQSIMACETGEPEKAERYFDKTARMDLEDVHGNTRDGIHTASMAGSWMSTVYGFAGFRDWAGNWSFAPSLPKRWKRLAFRLRLGESTLAVEIDHRLAAYTLEDGEKITITHRNETFDLHLGERREFSLIPTLRAAIFDLDGVITDTAELHYRAWKELADSRGLSFDRKLNERLRGVSRMDSLGIILGHNGIDLPLGERQALAKAKNDRYVELLGTLSERDILPGVCELLEGLRARGVKTALASASKNAYLVLDRIGLRGYFDAVADAGKIALAKPEPDLFLEAARLVRAWPADCVGIEDAQSGINAIRVAGMKAVAVGRGLTGADAEAADTAVISVRFLESLFG